MTNNSNDRVTDAGLAQFTDYFARNYPQDTVIYNPNWHAPKIFAAAKAAMQAASPKPSTDAGLVRDLKRRGEHEVIQEGAWRKSNGDMFFRAADTIEALTARLEATENERADLWRRNRELHASCDVLKAANATLSQHKGGVGPA